MHWEMTTDLIKRPPGGLFITQYLGYTTIAVGLAHSISALDENVSTVIGIEGQWGRKNQPSESHEGLPKIPSSGHHGDRGFLPRLNSSYESPVYALMLTIAAWLARFDTLIMAWAGKLALLVEAIFNYAQQTPVCACDPTRW